MSQPASMIECPRVRSDSSKAFPRKQSFSHGAKGWTQIWRGRSWRQKPNLNNNGCSHDESPPASRENILIASFGKATLFEAFGTCSFFSFGPATLFQLRLTLHCISGPSGSKNYVWISSMGFCVPRIATWCKAGGHDVFVGVSSAPGGHGQDPGMDIVY